uniref:Sulfotransferase n=1 Tax=Ciona intestinalis TaxID=7719 RepID=F6TLK5_CIOIN|nr:cytosolic sulfotransferase 5-like [Ciona intestinalis]|eukprot:XP_002132023.2 cytosolic sulfotransferase 5-like [Ciona intestinalis]
MADEETAKIKKMLEATFETGFKELAKYADDLPDYKPIVDYFVTSIFERKVTEWKGYKMSGQGFSCDTIKWVYENWTPWKDDVIVASFPKTGTTWVRNIVAHLYYRDNKTLMEMVKPMAMPHIYLETGIPLKFEILEKLPWKRRIFATHVSAPLFNFEKVKSAGAKVIYTIRNPKDQVVSWYNMMQNFPFQATDVNAQKCIQKIGTRFSRRQCLVHNYWEIKKGSGTWRIYCLGIRIETTITSCLLSTRT